MNIENTQDIQVKPIDTVEKSASISTEQKTLNQSSSHFDNFSTQMIDKATGILQTIVKDKLSEEVINKMPEDEYLRLLSLLDEMISGSVDNRV